MAIYKWSGSGARLQLDELRQVPGRHRRRRACARSWSSTSCPRRWRRTADSRDAPKDFNVYKQFIQAVVQHCVDKYGAADVGKWYWEVWNEPDYAGFWNGSDTNEALARR